MKVVSNGIGHLPVSIAFRRRGAIRIEWENTMNSRRLQLRPHLVALASLFLVCTASQAQSMKPGLWEIKQQTQLDPALQAQMDQARQQMAALPPEQRKMMESMMAQRGMSIDMAGGGMTMKVCVSKEQAEHDEPPVDEKGDCKHDIQRKGNVIHTRFACSNPPSEGEGDVTITSPQAYSMKMHVTTQDDGKPRTMTMNGTGRWLGTDCGNIKPSGTGR